MSTDLSKLCADYLRTSYASQTGSKLKASHARELVAAYFGYKSHAALTAEKSYPIDNLEDAGILIPDLPLLKERRAKLKELPDDLPETKALATSISSFLSEERYLGGDVWLYDTLESYVMEVLLIDNDNTVSNALSGVMAETNAEFSDFPYYEDSKVTDTGETLEILVSGSLQGAPLDDKPFCGDTIDMSVRVILYRIAGKRGFQDFEIEAGGEINDDWVDPEMKYGVPNVRPKDQILEMTGGLRFGETPEQFQNRQTEIHALRNRIADGKAKPRDIDRLSKLLGNEDSEEF